MKVGMGFPDEWKDKSKEKNILLSDLLYGFIIEDFILRLKSTSFYESLLLQSEEYLGEEAYRKKVKDRLDFYYIRSEKKHFSDRPVAGQSLSAEVIGLFLEELCANNQQSEIDWESRIEESENCFLVHLQAKYLEMQVPVNLKIEELEQAPKVLKAIEIPRLFKTGKSIACLCYSKENILGENLFEMMKKLELISDMSVYDTINVIIKNQTISGRHVLEELQYFLEKEPKVLSMKRLDQMKSYRNYGYMRKRWQQYNRRLKKDNEDWEVVLERILKFLGPVWTALCNNEIFFDDWMPELERFLG